MKKTIMLLVMLLSLTAAAQTLTESEKQAALKCATDFCSLLTRFSNGERTLDTQINNLCSGADCSAFDDIKTDKETTLRNYLLAIQARYPQSLPMTITPPTLAKSRVYGEPDISMSQSWGKVTESEISTTEIVEIIEKDYLNKYVTFDVTQAYTSLHRTVDKKLIYDVNAGKITAVITNSGAYINWLNGWHAFAQKDYRTALSYFENAAQNTRASFIRSCYAAAIASAIYIQDYQKALRHAERFGNEYYVAVCSLMCLVQADRYSEMMPAINRLESILTSDKDLTASESGYASFILGTTYMMPDYPGYNMVKGLRWLQYADAYGNPSAGYNIYVWHTYYGREFVEASVAEEHLLHSVKYGYPPAFYAYGLLADDDGDDDIARQMYEKSIAAGNNLAMASLGKLLIETGDKEGGIRWLRKALSVENIEQLIEEASLVDWPESKQDIIDLIEETEPEEDIRLTGGSGVSSSSTATSYTPSYSQSSAPSSTSSSSSSSSYNYSGYSSYRGSSHHFNYAKDDYCMGLSIGYVRKEWVYDYGDAREKLDIFWEDQYTNGIQAGLRVDCQFGYGLGLDSGLYYEYYSDKGNRLVEDDIEYYYRMKEHALYLPLHFKYNLNFSRWFQLGLYAGLGFDYGVSGIYLLYCGSEELDSFSIYDKENDLKRFNASFEYGASVRMRRLQINFTMARGLVNMSGHDDYTVKQNKTMSLSASLCF